MPVFTFSFFASFVIDDLVARLLLKIFLQNVSIDEKLPKLSIADSHIVPYTVKQLDVFAAEGSI